jgi:uncharacterized protein YcbK (DUF882 family)
MKTFTSIVFLFLWACTSTKTHPPEAEGESELDPGPVDETDTGQSDDEPDEVDTGVVIEPSDQVVCYPGSLEDYTACFGLVEYSDTMGPSYEYPEPYEGSEQYLEPTRYVDLSSVDHSSSLAPNFGLGELMHVDKGQFGLFQVHAVESLQAIRDASGGALYVTSGYRNVTYNEDVGGATWSRHMYGDAVDMHSDVLSLSELGALCDELDAGFVKYYDTHVHCDWRDDPLDESFFD